MDARGRRRDDRCRQSGERIGGLAKAGIVDLDRALIAAEKGFTAWRATSAFERAKIMQGGRPDARTCRCIGNRGKFFEPSVLVDVPTEAWIMNEELFGPVAIINRFGTQDEAIAEANRLPYGLAAYAFTRSASTMQALVDQLETGMITINHLGLALREVPFGGVQDSGYGTEGGADALEPYLVAKFVTQAHIRTT
jgi:acyl-CoA reductase-like NAD-dependent aldehyde dehydrogenase